MSYGSAASVLLVLRFGEQVGFAEVDLSLLRVNRFFSFLRVDEIRDQFLSEGHEEIVDVFLSFSGGFDVVHAKLLREMHCFFRSDNSFFLSVGFVTDEDCSDILLGVRF